MKATKKILSYILAFITLFSLASCTNKKQSDDSASSGGDSAATEEIVEDKTSAKVEGTLHKVNVTENNRPFIVGGKTDYQIVVADEAAEAATAASFIVKHLASATGATLKTISYEKSEEAEYTDSAKYIYVGKNAAYTRAGLTKISDDIGNCGYYIKSKGNSVFIVTDGVYGYQMGAIAFLREVVGYDMYADDCVAYDRVPSTLPDMDIIERPDFDYRHWSNPLSDTELYGMGYSTHKAIISVDGREVHNSFKWLPKDTYMEKHPKWYADNGSQLCYTAHGDKEEYAAMQEAILTQMKQYADENPGIDTIAVSQEDDPEYCKCASCEAATKKYGSINGTTIPFLNDLSDAMNEYFAAQAQENGTTKRTFYIIQFAYQQTLSAPVKQNESTGAWEPIDETVRCRDTVGIEIAPLEARFTRDFDHSDNSFFNEEIQKWGAVTKNIYFWWYETNFSDYMFPYNCWSTMVDQYRFCYQVSSRYMFNEGQLGQANGTAFTKLKDYIDSKALFDVNVNTEEVIAKFFKGYFGAAEEPMREYFNELQTYMTYLQDEYPDKLTGSIYEMVAKNNVSLFWQRKTIDGYMDYIDIAYDAIKVYETSNPERYSALYDHITIESLFPRYVLCKYYDGEMSPEEKTKMRSEFKSDNVRFGNTYEQEHVAFSATYSDWGV